MEATPTPLDARATSHIAHAVPPRFIFFLVLRATGVDVAESPARTFHAWRMVQLRGAQCEVE
jgi:hypothetical protein